METDKAIRILSALAEGVDPHTGETFPADSAWQHPDTVRALFAAVRILESRRADQPALEQTASRPKPVGKAGSRWSPEEDAALIQSFDAGTSIPDLAKAHQRSRGAIEARLVRLGKLDASQVQLPSGIAGRIAPGTGSESAKPKQ